MLILNCGGTFNKRYNPLNGELEVPFDNYAIEKILTTYSTSLNIAGAIYKDSLEMDVNDRKAIADIIRESDEETFIVVHGTDTMNLTAEFLDEVIKDKKIILTGAMKPFEIDNIEASLNLGMSLGFLQSLNEFGVYICMSGLILPWNNISKNIKFGKFELVK